MRRILVRSIAVIGSLALMAACSDGFETRPSGLKIKIAKPGTGDRVAEKGDQVSVHYTGWLWVGGKKGDQFDTSRDRGQPLQFTVGTGRVIKGWDEGIAGMKVGEQRLLIIPPDIAYGPQGRPKIPANSTLFFETELVAVKSQEEVKKEREAARQRMMEERAAKLAANAKPITMDEKEKSKWTVEESGLFWQTVKKGSGAEAQLGQKVSVHYTGRIWENGQLGDKFDSSLDRGQPFEFQLGQGQVIQGWDMGVKGMKVGEKRLLLIPAGLAYGERAMGPKIKAYSNLHFEVELLGVQ